MVDGIGVEGEVVGIVKVLEVRDGAGEGVGGFVPAVEDVDGSAGVVGAVVHVGDEDAVVGGFGEEADAAQALGGDVDGEVGGEVEGEGAAVGEMDGVRGELLGGERKGREQDRQE